MKGSALKIALALLGVAFLVWIGMHLEFKEATLPMPLTGEARRNPYYAVELFSAELGADATWERVFTVPRADSVLMLSRWNWTLSRARRARLERWVENGGRLVVDQGLIGDVEEFGAWSGIRNELTENPEEDDEEFFEDDATGLAAQILTKPCRALVEDTSTRTLQVCGLDLSRSLVTSRKILWALRDGKHIHALRVAVGRGSVTVINGSPFRRRDLFLGEHAALLVRATQLHAGDELTILTEENHASLMTLTWRFGAPVLLLALVAIAFGLWRASARFGPPIAPTEPARRSLSEQIRGTGRFALRFGGGRALHAATVRALRDAALRRLPAYDRMSAEERVAALSKLTSLDASELAPALHASRHSHELRHAIAVLEAARRRLSTKRSNHGN